MKVRVLFAFMLLACSVLPVRAQQEAQFSHNMFNNMGINPGLAGMRKAICATALARQQWVGFKDTEGNSVNPETYSMMIDAPIPFLRGGLALGFLQDQLGMETSVGARISYAYHMPLGAGRLGVGGQVGFIDKRIDFSGFTPISGSDPVLIGGEESHMFADFSLGGFYMLDEEIWGGLSFSQIRQATGFIGESSHSLKRHIYATAGYNFGLPAFPKYEFSPSLLIKTDFSSLQTDLNALVTYNKQFWGGVSYRPQDAIAVFLGVRFDQISFGYAYDITTSAMGALGRSYGSHEIMLQYCFELDVDKIQKIQRNIRFL